ncbi:MAG: glycosyltransferase family 4 protein [Acidobacteria bacterium]|nr:glycosyltransferase family 4 protein [Acidobacteriota bacterium]
MEISAGGVFEVYLLPGALLDLTNMDGRLEGKSKDSMRVLFLMPRVCWPPQTGLMLRNYYLARELARAGAHVTCLSFADDEVRDGGGNSSGMLPAPPEEWCEQVVKVERASAYTPSKILRGVLGRTPLPALNYTTPAMRAELSRVLEARPFDVVQVETSTLTEYLNVIRAARHRPLAVCDWHNIDSELMLRYSEKAAHVGRKLYARITAHRMVGFERNVLQTYDGHLAVSERDAAQLRLAAPGARVTVIENGVDVNYYSDENLALAHQVWRAERVERSADEAIERRRVVFVGSMDYHANVDAVVHFAQHTWPEIRRRRPELIFTVVGRNPAPEVERLAALPGVEVTGTVPDVRPFYREAVAQIVPLRVGGGSRLKILEAMAASVPVISTTLGAEGLLVSDNVNIMLADTAGAMGNALDALAENDALRTGIIREAGELVRKQYDWSALGAALHREHESLLRQAGR